MAIEACFLFENGKIFALLTNMLEIIGLIAKNILRTAEIFQNFGNFQVLSLSCKSYCQVCFDFGGLRFLERVLEHLKRLLG